MDPQTPRPPQRSAVCLLADSDVYDRVGCSLRYLFVGLIDEGVIPIVIGPGARDSVLSGPVELIEYVPARWPLRQLAIWALVDDVRERLEDLRFETAPIIHALDARLAPEAQRLSQAIGADVIVSIDDIRDAAGYRALRDMKDVRCVGLSTEPLQGAFLRARTPEVRGELIRYGLPADERPAAFRAIDRSPAILFAGPLVESSRVGDLVLAFKSVHDVHAEALLFIIGSGPEETALRRRIEELELEDAVMFTGRLEAWSAALAGADAFCIPSAETTASAIPIQALALGLAVVAAAGGVHDCLVGDETAWLFPEGDAYALAQQLRRAIENRPEAIELATRGQAKARANHSVGRMVEGFARMYQEQFVRRRTLRLDSGR